MSTITLQNADNALKTVYLDVITEQLNHNTNPFLAAIEHSTEDVWGKEVRKMVTYGVNGGFGAGTEDSVRGFQSIFGLPATGIIDYATWYKISEIYVAVTRIAELV